MNGEPMPDSNEQSLQRAREIDARCDQFEAAWQAGIPLEMETLLSDCPAEIWDALLQELTLLDAYYRSERGQDPRLED